MNTDQFVSPSGQPINDAVLKLIERELEAEEFRGAEFDPNQPRDEFGRWTDEGSTFVSAPEDALDDLSHGDRAAVAKGDVRDLVMMAADHESPVDLTNLTIEGTPLFDKGKNIDRAKMPQIPGAHREAFFKELRERGVSVTRENVSPGSLLPTQGEINAVRVGQMLRTYEESDKTLREIMISRDDYVLDGHHRWAVQVVLDADNPRAGIKMPVERLGVDHRQALALMRRYNKKHGVEARELAFNPDQPRDEQGQWTTSGNISREEVEKVHAALDVAAADAALSFGVRKEKIKTIADSSYEQRAAVKQHVVGELAARWVEQEQEQPVSVATFKAIEGIARKRVDLWAETSGDHDRRAVLMQHAIKDEFGLEDAPTNHMGRVPLYDAMKVGAEPDFGADEMKRVRGEYMIDRRYSRTEYDNTQRWFKERGITHVSAYRGMRSGMSEFKDPNNLSDEIEMQPASSWTTDRKVAYAFAKGGIEDYGSEEDTGVLEARIPVARVLSTAVTGRGCLPESEIIVLGGKMKVKVRG